MKKVILILLCLALTLNFASAVAETAEKTAIGTISMNGAFELRGVLPEGYQLTSRFPLRGRQQAGDGHFHCIRGIDGRSGSAQ